MGVTFRASNTTDGSEQFQFLDIIAKY